MTDINEERDPTFKQFDYRVRLNKGTERKMLLEVFRRLEFFESLEKYCYIGFGATTFTDFVLFHKELNIGEMVSIEKYEEYERRCNFNKPFDCIKIKIGESNDVLTELSWEKRVIAWLDYDGRLDPKVQTDINYAVSRVKSGSMLVVTVYAGGYRSNKNNTPSQETKKFRDLFENQSGLSLPPEYTGKHLQGIEIADTCQSLV